MANPRTSRDLLLWLTISSVVLVLLGAFFALRPDAASESTTTPQVDSTVGDTPPPTLDVRANSDLAGRLMDPQSDGWQSEVFAEWAKRRLQDLLDKTIQGKTRETREGCTTDTCRSPRFDMTTVFAKDGLRVRRPMDAKAAPRVGLAHALSLLTAPLVERQEPETHIKVVDVQLSSTSVRTTSLYDAHALGAGNRFQQTAQLDCVWSTSDERAKLQSLEIRDLEETELQTEHGWFTDLTERVLSAEPSYHAQLKHGTNHWMQRIERAHGMDDSVRSGLAVGDANGDGLDDVYLCQPAGLPNKLLLHQPDGTVRDISLAAQVDWLDQTSAALFVDLDNDGDQDLAIATTGALIVMSNDGTATFHLRAKLTPQMTDVQSLTACDYDLDGDLDLFLCCYRHASLHAQGEFVVHDATTGGRNYLFRNDISRPSSDVWTFADATQETGLHVGSTRYALAAAWHDYDEDGDSDLYLANDYGPNILYQNRDGHFFDVTEDAGLRDTGFGMSVDWGDYNRDGRADLYVGNMFSSAGSRVTRQPEFQRHASAQQRTVYQRMAQGNSLFRATSENRFTDVSESAHVQMGRWAWSSVFADLNNDGWQDLVVANGYITADDSGDL